MLSAVIAGSKIVSGISVAKEFAPQSGQQQAEEQRTVTVVWRREGESRCGLGTRECHYFIKQVRADFLTAWR